jgi:biopolymer transport protein ExbD
VNFSPARRRAELVVDVTPLIDIIFQLVLFFMVSTTFVTAPGIQVDLPRSSATTVLQEKEDLNVWITVDGAVFLDDVPVDLKTLRAAFAAAVAKDPNTVVVVKADQDVDHGRVVAVMDLARNNGLGRLAIATEANVAAEGGGAKDPDGP